jgi:hypothetical protein
MSLLRGEHRRGAVLHLSLVRFVRFPQVDTYLAHIEAELRRRSDSVVSRIERFPRGLIAWGERRDRGLVIVSVVEPGRYEGLQLVGYFPPEEIAWMRQELDVLLPGLRLLPLAANGTEPVRVP